VWVTSPTDDSRQGFSRQKIFSELIIDQFLEHFNLSVKSSVDEVIVGEVTVGEVIVTYLINMFRIVL
jgi:hypothetical protein